MKIVPMVVVLLVAFGAMGFDTDTRLPPDIPKQSESALPYAPPEADLSGYCTYRAHRIKCPDGYGVLCLSPVAACYKSLSQLPASCTAYRAMACAQ